MKKIIAAAAIALASATTAQADSRIPADLHLHPAKFCFVAAVMSAGIMERFNVGQPIEYTYAEINRLQQEQLRTYLNETTTIAGQFYRHNGGAVDVKRFANWNHERCLRTMKPMPAETYEIVDGKIKKVS